jgi:hypothetical protein
VHPGADLAGGKGTARALDDRERVERGVGEPVTAGDAGHELLGLGADDLELTERTGGEPR